MIFKDEYTFMEDTWCGLNRPDVRDVDADVVVFGIGYEGGVSYRGGAAEGPALLRSNTLCSTAFTECFQSFRRLVVHDSGDFVAEGPGQGAGGLALDTPEFFREISEYVCKLVQSGTFFTAIGGDHSVTIPILQGIDKALDKDFGIIHIDAHFDLCDSLGGNPLSHGSTQRRALELDNISGTDNIFFIGVRSIEPDEYVFKKGNHINVINGAACHKLGMDMVAADVIEHMSQFEKVYITLDIDCLDPAYAAGTGTPQMGGLYSRQLIDLIKSLFMGLPIMAMDVVEISPKLDPALTSMFAGRKIIQEAWGCYAAKIGKLDD